jgi:hypothetical protein
VLDRHRQETNREGPTRMRTDAGRTGQGKALVREQGQDVGLDGVLKLLKIHPEHGKCVTEWMPPHPKLPRIIRRGTEQR